MSGRRWNEISLQKAYGSTHISTVISRYLRLWNLILWDLNSYGRMKMEMVQVVCERMCVRVLQRKGTNWIYIKTYVTDLLKELAPAVTEVEKSLSLCSASWRIREAGSVIQFQSEGLKTMGADALSPGVRRVENLEFWCPRAAGGHPSWRRERICLFVPFRPSMDWMRVDLFSQSTKSNANQILKSESLRETLS